MYLGHIGFRCCSFYDNSYDVVDLVFINAPGVFLGDVFSPCFVLQYLMPFLTC